MQGVGQVIDFFWMIEAVGVDLVAKGVAGFVGRLELRVLVGLHVVVAHQVRIRADADVLDTDQFDHMVNVIDDVFDGRGLAVLHEVANAR